MLFSCTVSQIGELIESIYAGILLDASVGSFVKAVIFHNQRIVTRIKVMAYITNLCTLFGNSYSMPFKTIQTMH